MTKLYFILLVSSAIVIASTATATLAQTSSEAKYLANIDRAAKTLSDRAFTRIHASTSTSYRLQYGYGVCLATNI